MSKGKAKQGTPAVLAACPLALPVERVLRKALKSLIVTVQSIY